MSREYDKYLEEHRRNVKRGFEWLRTNLPQLFEGRDDISWGYIDYHDKTKYNKDEYDAYDRYFYGGNRSFEVVNDFNKAWLLHIHRNAHHWQHWVLINDDPAEGEILIEMPYNNIIEMICDWWAFSWQKKDLSEIFSWYDEHSTYIKLAPKTRQIVDDILWELRGRLGFNVLAHHGIKGQKWGVRNGPPYPIKRDSDEKGNIKTVDGSRPLNIPRDKFTNYALNPKKAPNKARAFELALGYNSDNCTQLIKDVENGVNIDNMVKKGDNGHGMRYEQIMKIKGPNNKEANVLTAWIDDGNEFRLTSVYITKKEEKK